MKQLLLSILLCVMALASLQAQDMITKRTGEKLEAKVLEISTTEIKYKRFSNLEGPTYVVPKNEVMLIQYADNTTETFDLDENATASAATVGVSGPVDAVASTANSVQLYNKGQSDALTYYDGYKAASTGVLVTSLISPLIGLVPAVITSSTPPKYHNLDAPSSELLQQQDYTAGYTKKAHKIKSGKVWKNWAIGFGANIIAVLLISSN